MVTIFNGLFLLYIYAILLTDHIYMYAQFLIHISIAKSAYNNRESTILYYNSITLSASYGHVTFIASRSCKSSRSWFYLAPILGGYLSYSCTGFNSQFPLNQWKKEEEKKEGDLVKKKGIRKVQKNERP